MTVPDSILQQFRTVALERLDRVEHAWATVLTRIDDEAIAVIHREIHTLKGESQLVGFADINLVCHKLEDLLEVARTCGYAVDEDFDLAINMALRFMAMLVRKKIGSQLAGINLPGFIRQIDRMLAEARGEATPRARNTTPMHRVSGPSARVSPTVRARLSTIALDLFLEYAESRGTRRNRLRTSWHSLRDLVGVHRALIGTGQLVKHQVGAYALAKELGKQLEVVVEIASAEVTTDVLAAIDLAVLHLVRNAIDHGIEPAADRIAAGKPATGIVRVRGALTGDTFELTVSDDGCGIAFDRVRQRAAELGIVAPADDASDRWIDVLCFPGLSTRSEATDVSGRGVGLDAARASIVDVGGSLTLSSTRGAGTSWKFTMPITPIQVDCHMFRAADVPVPVAIDSSWTLSAQPGHGPIVDLGALLGLGDPASTRADAAPVWFERGADAFAIVAERAPALVQARKLVMTPVATLAEIIVSDGVESLLLRPDQAIASSRR